MNDTARANRPARWRRRLKFETRLALLVGLGGGAACLLVVPPVTTYDAPAHYYRAVAIERGGFRPRIYSATGVGDEIPGRYVHFVETLWSRYWGPHEFGHPAVWRAVAADAERQSGHPRMEFTNTAVYSPVNYVFSSAGMGLAALLSRSPLAGHAAGCAANLLGTFLLVALAIELIPRWERGVLLLATTPLVVVQAASLSTDGINFALPLLLVALVGCLRAAVAPRPGLLAATLAAAVAVALLKPTAVAGLLCLVLIPAGQFGSPRRKLAGLALGLAAAGLAWFAWNRPYFDIDVARYCVPTHVHTAAMKADFRAHPWAFLPAFGGYLARDSWAQLAAFFGQVGGWVSPEVYRWLPAFAAIFFLGLLSCDPGPAPADRRWGAVLLAQGLASLALTALTLYVTFGEVGTRTIFGFGGRYYHGFVLGVGLAVAEFLRRRGLRWRAPLFWLGLTANVVFFGLILVSIGRRVL